MVEIEEQRMIFKIRERAALNSNLLQAIASIPKGSAVAYDFGVIAKKGDTTSSIEFAGAVHHVMARGDRRKEILRDERGRWKFLGYLAEGGERFRVKVYRQPASNGGPNH
jgi:hypothetical protein